MREGFITDFVVFFLMTMVSIWFYESFVKPHAPSSVTNAIVI